MSNILAIVESPSKCNNIQMYLQRADPANKYTAIASFGHFRLIDGLRAISPNFAITYTIDPEKMQNVSKMTKAIKSADIVLIATDNDREGEAIGWHICDYFKLPVATTRRLIFHEITESAIKSALKSTTYLNMSLIEAQKARQILDMYIGYKISPVLWKEISRGLSAGRCQTPALRLVYESFNNNLVSATYSVKGYFPIYHLANADADADTDTDTEFDLNMTFNDENALCEYLDLCKTHSFILSINSPKETTKRRPLPLTTSSLQQLASNELKFSPSTTMICAQKLYEQGYITYMRTDSITYCAEFAVDMEKHILSTYGAEYYMPLQQTSDAAAHEAIRPTRVDTTIVTDDRGCKRLYELINRRATESLMADAKYVTTTAEISAPKGARFVAKSEQLCFAGWTVVKAGTGDVTSQSFDDVSPGTIVPKKILGNFFYKEGQEHYTEAKLVSLLEDKGIGRPSTFATLVETIKHRDYVKLQDINGKLIKFKQYILKNGTIVAEECEKIFGQEKRKLVITPLGTNVIEYLIQNYNNIFNYDYTSNMETELDKIANGTQLLTTVCQTLAATLNDITPTTVKTMTAPIISIGQYENSPVFVKHGKFGAYAEYNKDKRIKLPNYNDSTTFDDIIAAIREKETNIIRVVGTNTSIRCGEYGDYIYFVNSINKKKKPQCISLNGFDGDYRTCDMQLIVDWIRTKQKNK